MPIRSEGITIIDGKEIVGFVYALPYKWPLPVEDKPIKYLEIGVLCGLNAIAVESHFGKHHDSEIYCVDPWDILNIEYQNTSASDIEYDHSFNYHQFKKNVAETTREYKFKEFKGFSSNIIPQFQNDFFDIIYIDGNHSTENVLEDAVLSYRKLKSKGYLIFDDYGKIEVKTGSVTQKGIDAFVDCYSRCVEVVGNIGDQLFLRKI